MAKSVESQERKVERWDARMKKRGFLAGRHWSIRCALKGWWFVCRTQPNAWVHMGATCAVVAIGIAVRLSIAEWLWIVAAIGAVWAAELLNTAIEVLCDTLRPEFDERIGRVKDVAAAGVLATAVTAAVIGAIVFWPHIVARL